MSIPTFKKRQRTFNPSRFRCCSFWDLCQSFTEHLHGVAAEAAVRDNLRRSSSGYYTRNFWHFLKNIDQSIQRSKHYTQLLNHTTTLSHYYTLLFFTPDCTLNVFLSNMDASCMHMIMKVLAVGVLKNSPLVLGERTWRRRKRENITWSQLDNTPFISFSSKYHRVIHF